MSDVWLVTFFLLLTMVNCNLSSVTVAIGKLEKLECPDCTCICEQESPAEDSP